MHFQTKQSFVLLIYVCIILSGGLWNSNSCVQIQLDFINKMNTLASGIDVGQGINVGPGKFGKKNKRRALNTH